MKIPLLYSFSIYCMLASDVPLTKYTHCTPVFSLYVCEGREASGSLFQADSVVNWGNGVLLNLHPNGDGLETIVLTEV